MPEAGPQEGTETGGDAVDQDRTPETVKTDAGAEAAKPPDVPAQVSEVGAAVELTSLAPEFVPEQHQSYLDRLTAALRDKRNRNIALTGRYGAGKSSVLGKYQEQHNKTTLRLAISSLGPNDEGASLTNRIQKEIVKQLIYSAEPRTLERSQFRRPVELSQRVAALQAAAVLAPLTMFLVLMGWLPTPAVVKSADPLVQVLVWLVLAAIILTAGTALRLLTHAKFYVSDVSAGGTTVKLSEKKLTYFDEYLDLIVNYFDSENIDVVIFEDLDRFDDPHIFEALRELNTLLNGPRRGKARSGQPLRFVYAVRDSLFERIGTDKTGARQGSAEMAVEGVGTAAGGDLGAVGIRGARGARLTQLPQASGNFGTVGPDDAARVETARANRTKFFEVVIPVVPFVSHRNARDLLKGLLEKAYVSVDRRLIDLVARHCTDMRLLRNMVNEYLVFAERLLHGEKQAPELDQTKLFALVAYKNFHMNDFENIARRTSALDTLYDDRRGLIRLAVEDMERKKRAILNHEASPSSLAPFAHQLGTTLNTAALFLRSHAGYGNCRIGYQVGDNNYTFAQATTTEFWNAVVAAMSLNLVSDIGWSVPLTSAELDALFPGGFKDRWQQRSAEKAHAEAEELDARIADVRGADFRRLVEATGKYTMPKHLAGTGGPGTVAWEVATAEDTSAETVTLADRVHELLGSELARDLVRGGHINLNYSVYAAQFYGNFAGIDVHTFLIQTEQTNSSDIDYKFSSTDAIKNLLTEASADFTSSVSAFNTDVLDWLLKHDQRGAADVVLHVMQSHDTSDLAQRFTTTYLTSGLARPQFVALLAHKEWRPVFTHLTTSADVPDDVRVDLVDAALRATTAKAASAFDTPADVADYLVGHYQQMSAYTAPESAAVTAAAIALLKQADVLLPDLAGLDEAIHDRVVEADLYELSAQNLRLAARFEGPVNLDRLRDAAPDTVYDYCLRNLEPYLNAVSKDDQTEHAVLDEVTLANALNTEWAGEWSSAERQSLFDASGASAALQDLRTVPPPMWEPLAEAGLFDATVQNIDAYLEEVGDVDAGLGQLLAAAGAITFDASATDPTAEASQAVGQGVAAEEQTRPERRKIALAVLNAPAAIASTEMRVQLASSLRLDTELAATDIAAEDSDLFARLLRAGLIADNADTFAHLATGGWAAIRTGIAASEYVATFLTPAHISGFVGHVLEDHISADKVGHRILADLDSFIPDRDEHAWTQVAAYALRTQTILSWAHLQQVAENGAGPARQTMQLIVLAEPRPQHVDEVLAVLSHLENPWSYLSTREATQFDAPDDPPFTAVLHYLASQDLLKVNRPKKDGTRTVTVQ